jgi:dihydropteroate synthase
VGQNTLFSTKNTLRFGGILHSLERPKLMGILNVTPDSFSDGGELDTQEKVLARAGQMIEQGASILDIGGYSTRPDADEISENEELSRVVPAISSIRKTHPDVIISIDTFRRNVAAKAIEAGADMVNDVTGGEYDPTMWAMVAEAQVPYVLMHMRGTPATMKQLVNYDNILSDILKHLEERANRLHAMGINDIIIDPGFGFAKTIDQNYYLLKNLGYFKALGLPLLVGISRKSMIFRSLDIRPAKAVNGSTVLNTYAVMHGASILRVHDIREAAECLALLNKIKTAAPV